MRTYSMQSINKRVCDVNDNVSIWSTQQKTQELIEVLSMLTHRISTMKAMVIIPGNRHRKGMIKEVLYCGAMKQLTKIALGLYAMLNALESRSKK